MSLADFSLPEFLEREPDGFVHFRGHRVGLHHAIRRYREGCSAEMILLELPTLTLLLVHKAIVLYLEHVDAVDRMIEGIDGEIDRQVAAAPPPMPSAELRRRIEAVARAKTAMAR